VGRARASDGIRRTIAQYCQLCDDGRFDEWIALFTADARFHVMGRTTMGRADIKAFMEVGQREELRGRHATFEPLIDLAEDGNTARVWTDFVFVDKGGTITTIGRYHDEMARGTDGRWRYVLHEIVFLGGTPELAQPTPA